MIELNLQMFGGRGASSGGSGGGGTVPVRSGMTSKQAHATARTIQRKATAAKTKMDQKISAARTQAVSGKITPQTFIARAQKASDDYDKEMRGLRKSATKLDDMYGLHVSI